MKVAIVEDDSLASQNLAAILDQTAQEQGVAIDVTHFDDGAQLVEHTQREFDIVYLDIQMRWVGGMEAAKELRGLGSDCLIVFVTNYVQYAIEGYSVDATDFLLKPVTAFAFAQHFKKVLLKLASRQEAALSFKHGSSLVRLPIRDITYVESRGHYLTICTLGQKYTIIESMKNMEDKLAGHHFFRSNNSFLVHLPYVSGIEGQTAVVGGERLQISRPRKKDFLAALTDYLGDELL